MAPQVGDYNNNTRQPTPPMGDSIFPGVCCHLSRYSPGHYKVYLLKKNVTRCNKNNTRLLTSNNGRVKRLSERLKNPGNQNPPIPCWVVACCRRTIPSKNHHVKQAILPKSPSQKPPKKPRKRPSQKVTTEKPKALHVMTFNQAL